VLKRMYGTAREEVAGGRRMLLGAEVCILWTWEDGLCWNVAHRWRIEKHAKLYSDSLNKGVDGINWRVVLGRALKVITCGLRSWFVSLRSGRCCGHGSTTSRFTKRGELLTFWVNRSYFLAAIPLDWSNYVNRQDRQVIRHSALKKLQNISPIKSVGIWRSVFLSQRLSGGSSIQHRS
jgi:hypothetical protein